MKQKLLLISLVVFLVFTGAGLSLSRAEAAYCQESDSQCSSPDGEISLGETESGCLNGQDWKYYRLVGTSGQIVKLRVDWAGAGCNSNDLFIYDDDCDEIDNVSNDYWTKIWTGSSNEGIRIGFDGDSSNSGCQWTLQTFIAESQPIGANLTVVKSVQNLSRGDAIWYDVQTAAPGDRLLFRVIVTSAGSSGVQNVDIREFLASNIIYQGNLKIDNLSDNRNILNKINLGNFWPGQTKTITFEAQVASETNFSYGATNLVNTTTAYTPTSAVSDSCIVVVNRPGVVAGATTVSTGLTNNIFLDSFLLPLLLSLFIVWLFRSRIVNFGKWADSRKEDFQDYKSRKLLKLRVAKIRAREFSGKRI